MNNLRDELNEEQRIASQAHGFTLVTAGAGTGKTRILANRFINCIDELLSSGKSPTEAVCDIFAVTFTEKATAEMVERVNRIIFERAMKEDNPQWFDVYRALDVSQISTIHSLCQRILSTHPFEAQVDPDFTIQPEIHELRDFTRDFLESVIRGNISKELRIRLYKLLEMNQFYSITRLLPNLFKKRNIYYEHIVKLAEETPEELDKNWVDYLELGKKLEEIQTIAREIEPQVYVLTGKTLEKVNKALSLVLSWNSIPSEDQIEEVLSSLKGLRSKKGNSLLEMLKTLREMICEISGTEKIADYAYFMISLAKLYIAFENFLFRSTDKKHFLDYNDLLIYANHTLNKPEMLKKLKDVVPSYLLIDEFQDISPLQWEILSKLLSKSKGGLMVGDEKQSIFRFQGSEVEVIRDGEKFVRERGYTPIPLKRNYRTLKSLLDPKMNAIFENLFSDAEKPYEARHQPLSSACNNYGNVKSLFQIVSLNGKVNIDIMAKWIMRYVVEILQNDPAIEVRTEDSTRNLEPGDIMVLHYSNNGVSKIVKELRAAGIPAVPVGKGGLYSSHEVKVLLHLLEFLNDQNANGILLSLLQSPLFSIPIGTIVEVTEISNDSLWRKLEQWTESSEAQNEDQRNLIKACKILLQLIDMKAEQSIDEILQHFLFNLGYAKKLCIESGEIAMENILKFLGILVYQVSIHGANLDNILNDIMERKLNDKNSYAMPLQTKNAVRVSTVHKAKGLEAPFVIVVEPSIPKRDRLAIIREIPGKVFVISKRNRDNPVARKANEINSNKFNAEKKRLFYVALTRAKDHLAIVGKNGGEYIKWAYDVPIEKRLLNEDDFEVIHDTDLPIVAKPVTEITQVTFPNEWIWASREIEDNSVKLISVRDAAKEILGIDTKSELSIPLDSSEESSSSSIIWGNVIHKALLQAPFKNSEHLKHIVKTLERIFLTDRNYSKGKLFQILEKFAMSKFHDILTSTNPLKEVPINYRIGNVLIHGFADLVVTDPPEVWDYKTGVNKELQDFYFMQVGIYRCAVARWLAIPPQNIAAKLIHISDSIHSSDIPVDLELPKKLQDIKVS